MINSNTIVHYELSPTWWLDKSLEENSSLRKIESKIGYKTLNIAYRKNETSDDSEVI